MLGEALRLIRVFHDKKLYELSKEIGVSPGYLSEVERGIKKPTLDLLGKYAKAFNTKPSVILFFAEDLDKEKKRGSTKVKLRNKLLKFLKFMDEKVD